MKRATVLLVFLSSILFLLAASALAQPGRGWGHGRCGGGDCPMGGPGGPGGPGMHMGLMGIGKCILNHPDIKVTPEQRTRFRALRDEIFKDAQAHREKMQAAHDAFLKALADPKVDAKQLKAKADAIHDLMKTFMDSKFDMVLKVREILTPEQLAKLPEACKGPPGPPPPAEE